MSVGAVLRKHKADPSTPDPRVWVYNSSQAQIAAGDDEAGNINFRVISQLTGGQTYYIAAGCYGSGTGSYSFRISLAYPTSSNSVSISINSANQKRYYAFVAPTTGLYSIESYKTASSTADPYVVLYNANQAEIDISDDHGGNHNFHILYNMKAGQTYYIAAGCYSAGTGSYTMKVIKRTPVNGAYISFGLPSRKVAIKAIGATATDATWYPLISDAVNSWNISIAGTGIALTSSASSSHTLEVISYATDYYGEYTALSINILGRATASRIRINATNLANGYGSSTVARKSTIAHEIGHLFCLNDNPDTTESCLMSHGRDRTTIYFPQYIDVFHVVNKYS